MTAPIASGFPDFGRFQAQSAKIYANLTLPAVNADFVTNIGYVGDVPHLGVFININAGTIVAVITFYTDAAGVNTVANHTASFRDGDSFYRTLPVLGPFCRINWFVGTTPIDMTVIVTQSTAPFSAFAFDSQANILAAQEAQVVPVGNTLVECTRVWPGEAVLFAALPAVVSSVTVYSVSSTGVQRFISRVFGNGVEAFRPLFLPATHIRLQLSNAGPGNQNFTYSLTALPLGA